MDIELFPVADLSFSGGPEFRSYLAEDYDFDAIAHNLTLVVGVTGSPKERFVEDLAQNGFSIVRELGEVLHIAAEDGGNLESYVTFEPSAGVVLFYTNYRKTESDEIPRIRSFLDDSVTCHGLPLRPILVKRILENLIQEFDNLTVLEFVAKRSEHARTDAQLRSGVKRTVSYWGMDGLDALKELGYQYGVLPHKLEISVPHRAKIKIDRDGYFTHEEGDFNVLLNVLEAAAAEAENAVDAFDSSSFDLLPIETEEKTFRVQSSTPMEIQLTREFDYSDAEDFVEILDNEGYLVLTTSAEEGSLFFSSDIASESGHRFRVKADTSRIRVLPEESPDFSSFMGFYDVVLEYVDPDAELVAGP